MFVNTVQVTKQIDSDSTFSTISFIDGLERERSKNIVVDDQHGITHHTTYHGATGQIRSVTKSAEYEVRSTFVSRAIGFLRDLVSREDPVVFNSHSQFKGWTDDKIYDFQSIDSDRKSCNDNVYCQRYFGKTARCIESECKVGTITRDTEDLYKIETQYSNDPLYRVSSIKNIYREVDGENDITNYDYYSDGEIKYTETSDALGNVTVIGKDISAIIIDIHCEATSEKMAIGHEFDGKASLIVGTHTHVPTADARILGNGTGFITDLGMCGDYDSIIGMDKNKALERFKKKIPIKGIHPATGEASLSSVLVELDERTGLAKSIKQIIKGGSLIEVS